MNTYPNGNGLSLLPLIKIDSTYKQKMILQTILSAFKKCKDWENRVENDGCAQITVVIKIKEMRYVVNGLLHDLIRPLWHLSLQSKAIWLEKILVAAGGKLV